MSLAPMLLTRRSFYRRQAAFFSFVLLCFMTGFLLYLVPEVTETNREANEREARGVAAFVAEAVGEPLRSRELRALEPLLRAAAALPSVRAVWLSDPSGRIVAGAGANWSSATAAGGGVGAILAPVAGGLATVHLLPHGGMSEALALHIWRDGVVALIVGLGLVLLLLDLRLRPMARTLASLTAFSRTLVDSPGTTLPIRPSVAELDELATAMNVASCAIAADRAALAHAKAEAERAGARLRTAIEALDDGFVLYGPDDRLVICNERYRRIYAESSDLIVEGARFEDIIREGARRGQYADAFGRIDEWVAERMKAHLSANSVIEQRLGDGRWLRISERRTPDGGIVGFRVDISELKEARARAEAASRAKSDFLANMSHEIRTPLNGIVGTVELLLATSLDEEQHEYADLQRASANHLLDLVNDILDFSKIEAGRLQLEHVPFSPSEALAGTLAELRAAARRKGIGFEVRDSVAAGLGLNGDAGRLRQILLNLAGNAVKFTQEGGVEVEIGISEMEEGTARLQLTVRDTGIGIPAHLEGRLFEAFGQGDASMSRRYGGTGLGLAICRRLVTAMGGRIWYQSEEGAGTTFRVAIPFERALLVAPGHVPRAGVEALRGLRVLVVEDNPVNRLVAERMLARHGAHVACVEDGESALAALPLHRPDVVLLDIQMPGLSGFEVTQHIRERRDDLARVTVIALTAHALAGDREKCLAAGMDGYVSKPFTARTLVDGIVGSLPSADGNPSGTGSATRFSAGIDALDGDEALLREAGAHMLSALPESLSAIASAVGERALASLEREAHRLKASWYWFARPGDELLPAELVRAARAGDSRDALAKAERLLAAMRALGPELRDWLGTLPARLAA